MVKVVRTDKNGNERIMTLEQQVWNRLVKKPHLIPGMKWKLWIPEKPTNTKFVEVPIDAEVEIVKKKAAPKKTEPEKQIDAEVDIVYGEKEYRADLSLAKKLVAEDKGVGAKEAFKRALAFKPKNPYIKSQLKKL